MGKTESAMKNHLIILLLLCQVLSAPAAPADYRLYGCVHTVDNRTYTGYISWNDKMYWTDIFRADKPLNPYAGYFSISDGISFYNNGNYLSTPPTHVFACRFGNIKTIVPLGYRKAELEIRDGQTIVLERGNYRYIGSAVEIYLSQDQSLRIPWEKISRIGFSAPDSTVQPPLSDEPICGIIKTGQGIYKGLITWDQDERTQESLLDGYTQRGEKHIPFRQIRQIVKNGKNCKIILKNGEALEMWGSNDVNGSNRGITVTMPNTGNVSFPWSSFELFEAVDNGEIHFLSYADFGQPYRIYGTVETRKGESFEGYMAYDLDEAMMFELLEGKNNNISYEIPFRYIRSIEPKNYQYSFVTLIGGESLSLGDSVDVNKENSGILLFPASESPLYIPWKQVKKITFREKESN